MVIKTQMQVKAVPEEVIECIKLNFHKYRKYTKGLFQYKD